MSLKEKLLKYKMVATCRNVILLLRDRNKNREVNKSFGEKNPEKIFYVIRNYTKEAGLGSIHNYVCLHVRYALDKGYIPIVDMKNYPNAYLEEENLHKKNSWEYFFMQPFPYELSEVYHSKNVILSGTEVASCGYIGMNDKEMLKDFKKIIDEYIQLNSDVEEEIVDEIKRVQSKGDRILGVVCRGTDYINLKPQYHAIPYSAEETLQEVKLRMKNYDKVYLATEDTTILEKFKSEIEQDKLIYTEAYRYHPSEVHSYLCDMATEESKKEKGINYLKVIYVLSICTSLMAPTIGGSITAARINGGNYEELVILEKGRYQ